VPRAPHSPSQLPASHLTWHGSERGLRTVHDSSPRRRPPTRCGQAAMDGRGGAGVRGMAGSARDWPAVLIKEKGKRALSQAPRGPCLEPLPETSPSPSPSSDKTRHGRVCCSSHVALAVSPRCALLCALAPRSLDDGSREDAFLGRPGLLHAHVCWQTPAVQTSSLAASRTLPDVNRACIPSASCCRLRIDHPGAFIESSDLVSAAARKHPPRHHQRPRPRLPCLAPDKPLPLSPLVSCARPAAPVAPVAPVGPVVAAQPRPVAVRREGEEEVTSRRPSTR